MCMYIYIYTHTHTHTHTYIHMALRTYYSFIYSTRTYWTGIYCAVRPCGSYFYIIYSNQILLHACSVVSDSAML